MKERKRKDKELLETKQRRRNDEEKKERRWRKPGKLFELHDYAILGFELHDLQVNPKIVRFSLNPDFLAIWIVELSIRVESWLARFWQHCFQYYLSLNAYWSTIRILLMHSFIIVSNLLIHTFIVMYASLLEKVNSWQILLRQTDALIFPSPPYIDIHFHFKWWH